MHCPAILLFHIAGVHSRYFLYEYATQSLRELPHSQLEFESGRGRFLRCYFGCSFFLKTTRTLAL